MTAVSPYAPHWRNSLLRYPSSLPQAGITSNGDRSRASSSISYQGTTAMAILLFILGFWKKSTGTHFTVKDLWQRVRRRLFVNKNSTTTIANSSHLEHLSRNIQSDDSDDHRIRHEHQHIEKNSFERIMENQRLIQQVLQFWFGQFSPEESQKRLWMIAHSSSALRKQVDQEIAQKYENLLVDLVELQSDGSSCRWEEWCQPKTSASEQRDSSFALYGYQGKIATIIVLDQFSRHIFRHHETNTTTTAAAASLSSSSTTTTRCASSLPSKLEVDALALKTAELLTENHADELRCGMIPLPMHIFGLMPFRHASTIDTVEFVQRKIEELTSLNTQMDAMLGRFRKATNRRMAGLQDEARRTGTQNEGEGVGNSNFTDEDILETFPFEADMELARNHPCVKTLQTFLGQCQIEPGDTESEFSPSPIIVSLSGGVDSMVIASVLAFLKKNCGYRLSIWAIHIDYANRPESSAEADFVRRYCETLNIQFQCRKIDEVTRGITARDDYERIARELRYTSYKETIVHATKNKRNNDNITVGVMLGHHRGDLRENVLSNAHKGCGPLDLSGMTAISKNDGVTIYRPLLPLEKDAIFDYAHKFGVPYFKDTTPHWSTRGKLRNQLIPLLEDIYGDGSMKNLSNLAIESDECRALLEKSMIGPFLDKIERHPMGIVFETSPWKEQAVFFWKFVLREALHSAKFGMFSDKSVLSFLERVQATKLKAGWLQCRRDYAVYLQGDGRVYVLFPSSFPFSKKDMYKIPTEAVPYHTEYAIGPWYITSEIISEKGDCPETFRLGEKAILSIDHFMKGVIEYVLEVPTWKEGGKYVPRPLIFTHFTKASRPSAWKNSENTRTLYLKVQETLPLLGNDKVAQAALMSPMVNGCVETVDGIQQPTPKRLVRVTLRVDSSLSTKPKKDFK